MMPNQIREMRRNIDSHGQHLVHVMPEGHTKPAFVYTIGNTDRGLPELLLIGNFPPHVAGQVLNELGMKMREGGKRLMEGLVDIGWSVPFKVRKAGSMAKSRYTSPKTNPERVKASFRPLCRRRPATSP